MQFLACILSSVHANLTRPMLWNNSPTDFKIRLKILSSKQYTPQVQSQSNVRV